VGRRIVLTGSVDAKEESRPFLYVAETKSTANISQRNRGGPSNFGNQIAIQNFAGFLQKFLRLSRTKNRLVVGSLRLYNLGFKMVLQRFRVLGKNLNG
jgi:hypothetical protein